MKKSASKKKEKIRDKIVDCEFSQKEFLLFKKNIQGPLTGLIKQNYKISFSLWQKSYSAKSLSIFSVFCSFLFLVWLQDILGGYFGFFSLCF